MDELNCLIVSGSTWLSVIFLAIFDKLVFSQAVNSNWSTEEESKSGLCNVSIFLPQAAVKLGS